MLAWPCVFGKQSLLPFPCDLQTLWTVHPNVRRLPLSRSYGVDLPSSFSRVVSSTLGYSPRPPVSVYGTGPYRLPCRLFLARAHATRLPAEAFRRSGAWGSRPCTPSAASISSYALSHASPFGSDVLTGCGNVRPLVIGYASRPRLRSRLTPGGLSLPGNPWTYGVRVFHPHFRILMPAFSFPIPPARIATRLPRPTERSPTNVLPHSTTSVMCLVPIIFGAGSLDQ